MNIKHAYFAKIASLSLSLSELSHETGEALSSHQKGGN